jgi:type IV secretion system protein VirB8
MAMGELGHALLVEQKALAEHFKEVESFQTRRTRMVKRLSRAMMVVTGVALLGNLAQAWTIATMLPLKQIVPVYLWVRPDGTIDNSISMSQLPPTQNKAVVNASLWEYVRLREGYSSDTAQYAYDVVSAYSASKVAEKYQNYFNYPNSNSPQITIGKRGSITVSHISSSDIGPALQQIRFKRTITIDGRQPVSDTMTATIGYATVRKLPAGMRLTNPGGVLVTSYQSAKDTPS